MAEKPEESLSLRELVANMRASFFGELLTKRDNLVEQLADAEKAILKKEKEFAKEMKGLGYVQADAVIGTVKAPKAGGNPDNKAKAARDEEQRAILAQLVAKKPGITVASLYDQAKEAFKSDGIGLQGFSVKTLKKKLDDPRFVLNGEKVSLAA